MAGSSGPKGPRGRTGRTGRVELVTCHTTGARKTCTSRIIASPLQFKTARIQLRHHGHVILARTAHNGHLRLKLATTSAPVSTRS